MRCLLLSVAVGLLLSASLVAQQKTTTTGTLSNPGDVVTVSTVNFASLTVQVAGNTSGGLLVFEGTPDGSATWYAVTATDQQASGAPTGSGKSQVSANGIWTIANVGYTSMRVRALTLPSGPVTITATRGFVASVAAPCNALLRAAHQC